MADAIFSALGYLGVRDLLSVEKVCNSLRDAVQNDPLLWNSLHPEPCGVNDTGPKCMVKSNPRLTKVSVLYNLLCAGVIAFSYLAY